MTRDEMIVAGLSASEPGATFSPVQLQKLFFVLDREAAKPLGGPHFNFQPYDYGPFDRALYDRIDALRDEGLVQTFNSGRYRLYSTTPAGTARGIEILGSIDPQMREYVAAVASWVRRLSFSDLVSAIYERYPDMRVNSIFRG
ncbi:hypothetical protein [Brevundimonas sp. SGAir0440]|uniref:hypothetical protein n=1 Tax=Brevundimonas sp. SGAir0440 TaxID=2579977 RepID=UPI0010CD3870|nr:hypothetical protein [Brevundimonas sp. SGAir0440]QCQ99171.1 hypothetical protein E7T10_11060 [Brevundimonas sp. SGAir0440]